MLIFTLESLLDRVDKASLMKLAKEEGTSHIVVYENHLMDSSKFGQMKVFAVGPMRTIKFEELKKTCSFDGSASGTMSLVKAFTTEEILSAEV